MQCIFAPRNTTEAESKEHPPMEHRSQRSITDRQQQLFPALSGVAVSIFEDDARYRQIFRNNPAIQVLIDPANGGIMDANDAACLFYGYDHQRFCTLTVFDLNTLSPREVVQKIEKALSEQGSSFRFTHRKADGATREVEIFTTPVTISGRDVLYSTVHDVTDRHRAEERLRFGEQAFRHFIENNPSVVAMFDRGMRYLLTSRKWMEAFGLQGQDLSGRPAHECQPRLPDTFRKCHAGIMEQREVFCSNEEKFRMDDGREHWLTWEMHPWYADADHIGGSILFVEFITEKKQASESARQLREERERLASRIEAIEEERRKISRELHDGVGQLLTAAYLNLELLESEIAENSGEAVKILHKVRKLLDATIQETRNISHDLRPAVLDDFGLIPGLRLLADEFSDATGINAIFQHFDCDNRLDPRLETTIYRICQEALNNIARHSGATEATIEIFRKGNRLTFTVNDNGSGIPEGYRNNQSFRAGTGLNNIKERVDLHHGTMQIHTLKKSGTELLVEFPLS